MEAWKPDHEYKMGDAVDMQVPRSRWRILWDRLRLFRWRVQMTEMRTHYCVGYYTPGR